MKDIKEFLRFLQQNKVMGLFINNLLKVRSATTYSILDIPKVKGISRRGKVMAYLKSQVPHDFLQKSFDWSSSNQGDPYWRDLNTQWREHLQIYKFKNTTS
jgi:hypothetical protein